MGIHSGATNIDVCLRAGLRAGRNLAWLVLLCSILARADDDEWAPYRYVSRGAVTGADLTPIIQNQEQQLAELQKKLKELEQKLKDQTTARDQLQKDQDAAITKLQNEQSVAIAKLQSDYYAQLDSIRNEPGPESQQDQNSRAADNNYNIALAKLNKSNDDTLKQRQRANSDALAALNKSIEDNHGPKDKLLESIKKLSQEIAENTRKLDEARDPAVAKKEELDAKQKVKPPEETANPNGAPPASSDGAGKAGGFGKNPDGKNADGKTKKDEPAADVVDLPPVPGSTLPNQVHQLNITSLTPALEKVSTEQRNLLNTVDNLISTAATNKDNYEQLAKILDSDEYKVARDQFAANLVVPEKDTITPGPEFTNTILQDPNLPQSAKDKYAAAVFIGADGSPKISKQVAESIVKDFNQIHGSTDYEPVHYDLPDSAAKEVVKQQDSYLSHLADIPGAREEKRKDALTDFTADFKGISAALAASRSQKNIADATRTAAAPVTTTNDKPAAPVATVPPDFTKTLNEAMTAPVTIFNGAGEKITAAAKNLGSLWGTPSGAASDPDAEKKKAAEAKGGKTGVLESGKGGNPGGAVDTAKPDDTQNKTLVAIRDWVKGKTATPPTVTIDRSPALADLKAKKDKEAEAAKILAAGPPQPPGYFSAIADSFTGYFSGDKKGNPKPDESITPDPSKERKAAKDEIIDTLRREIITSDADKFIMGASLKTNEFINGGDIDPKTAKETFLAHEWEITLDPTKDNSNLDGLFSKIGITIPKAISGPVTVRNVPGQGVMISCDAPPGNYDFLIGGTKVEPHAQMQIMYVGNYLFATVTNPSVDGKPGKMVMAGGMEAADITKTFQELSEKSAANTGKLSDNLISIVLGSNAMRAYFETNQGPAIGATDISNDPNTPGNLKIKSKVNIVGVENPFTKDKNAPLIPYEVLVNSDMPATTLAKFIDARADFKTPAKAFAKYGEMFNNGDLKGTTSVLETQMASQDISHMTINPGVVRLTMKDTELTVDDFSLKFNGYDNLAAKVTLSNPTFYKTLGETLKNNPSVLTTIINDPKGGELPTVVSKIGLQPGVNKIQPGTKLTINYDPSGLNNSLVPPVVAELEDPQHAKIRASIYKVPDKITEDLFTIDNIKKMAANGDAKFIALSPDGKTEATFDDKTKIPELPASLKRAFANELIPALNNVTPDDWDKDRLKYIARFFINHRDELQGLKGSGSEDSTDEAKFEADLEYFTKHYAKKWYGGIMRMVKPDKENEQNYSDDDKNAVVSNVIDHLQKMTDPTKKISFLRDMKNPPSSPDNVASSTTNPSSSSDTYRAPAGSFSIAQGAYENLQSWNKANEKHLDDGTPYMVINNRVYAPLQAFNDLESAKRAHPAPAAAAPVNLPVTKPVDAQQNTPTTAEKKDLAPPVTAIAAQPPITPPQAPATAATVTQTEPTNRFVLAQDYKALVDSFAQPSHSQPTDTKTYSGGAKSFQWNGTYYYSDGTGDAHVFKTPGGLAAYVAATNPSAVTPPATVPAPNVATPPATAPIAVTPPVTPPAPNTADPKPDWTMVNTSVTADPNRKNALYNLVPSGAPLLGYKTDSDGIHAVYKASDGSQAVSQRFFQPDPSLSRSLAALAVQPIQPIDAPAQVVPQSSDPAIVPEVKPKDDQPKSDGTRGLTPAANATIKDLLARKPIPASEPQTPVDVPPPAVPGARSASVSKLPPGETSNDLTVAPVLRGSVNDYVVDGKRSTEILNNNTFVLVVQKKSSGCPRCEDLENNSQRFFDKVNAVNLSQQTNVAVAVLNLSGSNHAANGNTIIDPGYDQRLHNLSSEMSVFPKAELYVNGKATNIYGDPANFDFQKVQDYLDSYNKAAKDKVQPNAAPDSKTGSDTPIAPKTHPEEAPTKTPADYAREYNSLQISGSGQASAFIPSDYGSFKPDIPRTIAGPNNSTASYTGNVVHDNGNGRSCSTAVYVIRDPNTKQVIWYGYGQGSCK